MEALKKAVGEKAAEYVENGMVVGLGTGSTAHYMILRLGERVQEGLEIRAVATSKASEATAREVGIPIVEFKDVESIDLAIDGADEIDPQKNLIKGGGGALLREKIIESFAKKLIIIVDESKQVDLLGDFKVPVEIVPFAWELTQKQIEDMGGRTYLRVREGEVFVTDNGNYILDCDFGKIEDPATLSKWLNMIPGVVENGIVPGMADLVVMAYKDGRVEVY